MEELPPSTENNVVDFAEEKAKRHPLYLKQVQCNSCRSLRVFTGKPCPVCWLASKYQELENDSRNHRLAISVLNGRRPSQILQRTVLTGLSKGVDFLTYLFDKVATGGTKRVSEKKQAEAPQEASPDEGGASGAGGEEA